MTDFSDDWLTGRVPLSLPLPSVPAEWDLLLLDRDGVLNRHLPGYRTPEDFEILPEVFDALQEWSKRAAHIVIVTNQQGLATGNLTWHQLAEVHRELATQAASRGITIAGFRVCPHEAGTCDCRKPAPGMLNDVLSVATWATPKRTVMIGDSDSDEAAASAAGIEFIRVDAQIGLRQTLTNARPEA